MIQTTVVATQQQRSALLQEEVARRLNYPVEDISVRRSSDGAPIVLRQGERIEASLSARGTFVLVGLADRPVGVDIEAMGVPQEPPWRVLAPCERKALAAIPALPARHVAFLKMWTAKEAVLKALGTGLRRDPASVAVTLCPDDSIAIVLDRRPLTLRDTAGGEVAHGSDRFVWRAVVL